MAARQYLVPQLEEWALEAFREMSDKERKDRKNVQFMQNKTAASIESRLDTLLDMASKKLIDGDEYEHKTKQLKSELKEIHEHQADTATRAENWYEFAVNTLEKLTDANQKFVDGDVLAKKDILLAIGQNPVLYEGKLQITPHEWLEPIRKNIKSIRQDLEEVRTLPQQIQKASEEAIRLKWQGH